MPEIDVLRDALDLEFPSHLDRPSDWDEVMLRATARTPPRRRRLVLRLASAAVIIAGVALFAVAPWKSERGLVERARAAVGNGTVVHLLLDEQWGGTVIDLKTGKHELLTVRREVWYDPARGLHEFSSLGGVIESDDLYAKDEVPAARAKQYGFPLRFREALDSGEARVVGSGVISGIPVDWVSVSRTKFMAEGRSHEASQDVAISKETLKPVNFRETVDGKQSFGVRSRVLQVELLPAGAGDFTKKQRPDFYVGSVEGVDKPGTPLSTKEASQRLSGKGLWLGPSFQDAKANLRTFDLRWPGTEIKGLRVQYSGVFVYETDRPTPTMEAAPVPYFPREGKLFLVEQSSGVLQRAGVYISVTAPSEKLLLDAARALRPISAGSGAGG